MDSSEKASSQKESSQKKKTKNEKITNKNMQHVLFARTLLLTMMDRTRN